MIVALVGRLTRDAFMHHDHKGWSILKHYVALDGLGGVVAVAKGHYQVFKDIVACLEAVKGSVVLHTIAHEFWTR